MLVSMLCNGPVSAGEHHLRVDHETLSRHELINNSGTGVYTTGPLTINISGVAALNPAMAGQVQTNPALAGLMFGSINQAAVPIEEGWVKLRGLDPSITKEDICTFFQVQPPGKLACKHVAVVLSLPGNRCGAVLFGALSLRAQPALVPNC